MIVLSSCYEGSYDFSHCASLHHPSCDFFPFAIIVPAAPCKFPKICETSIHVNELVMYVRIMENKKSS